MSRRPLFVATAILFARMISASGPQVYETPFLDTIELEDVLSGTFPERVEPRDVVDPLIMYLHLKGDLSESHARLFRSHAAELDRTRSNGGDWYRLWQSSESFWRSLRSLGYERPDAFGTEKSLFREIVDQFPDGTSRHRTIRRSIDNCQKDAFDTARRTLALRRRQYGSESVEVGRWIEAQIKVFAQCSGESEFVPPDEPAQDWSPLEQHDRRYQIAAAYFYAGRHLAAASRFDVIARTPDSPWRDLGRYLVPRSYLREAIVNENASERHLDLALGGFRQLAADTEYLARFPSVLGQIRRVETRISPVSTRRRLERQILEAPDATTVQDVIDYAYLRRLTEPEEPPFGEGATEYEQWRWYGEGQKSAAAAAARWRTERSLHWLYVALAQAGPDLGAATLAEILQAGEALPADTPGFVNVLANRIRILGSLGRVEEGLRIAEEAENLGLPRPDVNRVRLAAAEITTNWHDYLRLASLKPATLLWTDGFAQRLPGWLNRITSNTTLFASDATRTLNRHFTPTMILDVIDSPGLSDYQRGRMAMAAWTKAMLANDITAALKLSTHIRRNVPVLDQEFELFEEATDKLFEAARIIFDYPAFSPWMLPGVGRIQSRYRGTLLETRPMPDYVADGWSGVNWWCVARRYEIENARASDQALRHPRFARYSDAELALIGNVKNALTTAATTSFGPHVIRYAKENLDDPRVPRTLHRLVFATRHACYTAPGKISRAAYSLLHEHFPDSAWTEKTPYWYDGQI
ncbi:MAG: hypothetical protein OXH68_20040 [Gammaproteobacteria bacterium]|nr:hypothetical protein [Gammaproteobacteria bacterium]